MSDIPVQPTNVVPAPDPPKARRMVTMTVPVISLPVELVKASLGAIAIGLPTFVSSLAVTNVTDLKALETAGLAAGLVGAGFFAKSFNDWYNQKYGS